VTGYAPLLQHLDPERLGADPNPALLLADCLEVAHARGWNLDRFAAPLRQACEHALQHLNPPERAHLWRTLGRIGLDDRRGVGTKDGVPDIEWVEVPEGKFKYGDDKGEISLPAFRISRYPITNAQWQCFIDDAGYETGEWWDGLAQHPDPAHPGWNYPNHPRETVSWYEAMAFTRWLDVRLRARGEVPEGLKVRLPTEQEWEKAARGTDGREYPWGTYADGSANINETRDEGLGQTSAVGIYLLGASPCGALDMAGNVWEWCLNKYDDPNDLSLSAEDSRVLRGGSWGYDRVFARCAYRSRNPPDLRNYGIGFRVVLCAPPVV
jgi:formylglycine-generating enzyme required for sulfatase activity